MLIFISTWIYARLTLSVIYQINSHVYFVSVRTQDPQFLIPVSEALNYTRLHWDGDICHPDALGGPPKKGTRPIVQLAHCWEHSQPIIFQLVTTNILSVDVTF